MQTSWSKDPGPLIWALILARMEADSVFCDGSVSQLKWVDYSGKGIYNTMMSLGLTHYLVLYIPYASLYPYYSSIDVSTVYRIIPGINFRM